MFKSISFGYLAFCWMAQQMQYFQQQYPSKVPCRQFTGKRHQYTALLSKVQISFSSWHRQCGRHSLQAEPMHMKTTWSSSFPRKNDLRIFFYISASVTGSVNTERVNCHYIISTQMACFSKYEMQPVLPGTHAAKDYGCCQELTQAFLTSHIIINN